MDDILVATFFIAKHDICTFGPSDEICFFLCAGVTLKSIWSLSIRDVGFLDQNGFAYINVTIGNNVSAEPLIPSNFLGIGQTREIYTRLETEF